MSKQPQPSAILPPSKKGINRNQIVDTALRIAEEESLNSVTLGRLAKEFGIKTPSLYNHVASLNDLHNLMRQRGLRLIIDQMKMATIGKSKENAIDSLSHAYRSFAQQNPALYGLIFSQKYSDDEQIAELKLELIEIFKLVLAFLKVQPEEQIMILRFWRSWLHGFVAIENSQGFEIPVSVDQSFELMIARFVSSIGAGGENSF